MASKITSDIKEARVFVLYLLGTALALSLGLNVFVIERLQQPRPLNTKKVETVRQPSLVTTDHIRGNAERIPVVIEYSDFQCSFCREMHSTLKSLSERQQIAWVFRSYPLTNIHPIAMDAAVAAECAGQQGKFWQYADALFDNQEHLTPKLLADLASISGLEQNKFEDCRLSDGRVTVQSQITSAAFLGVDSTPTLFIDSKRVVGLISKEMILSMIQ